jgi:hypothetical protein
VAGAIGFTECARSGHGGALDDGKRAWAKANGVPLVDGIVVLDRQRDLLVTWVHLTPPANEVLAKAIATTILDLESPRSDGR